MGQFTFDPFISHAVRLLKQDESPDVSDYLLDIQVNPEKSQFDTMSKADFLAYIEGE